MIFDGHSDIFTDVTVRRLKGETQVLKNHHLPRLRKGNIEGGCFVLWIDPPYDADPAKRLGELMHCIKDEMAECEEAVVVKNLKEIEEARKAGKFYILPGLEGLSGIGTDLDKIDELYDFGCRHAMLSWNEQNDLSTGTKGDPNRGLTELGKKAVRKLHGKGGRRPLDGIPFQCKSVGRCSQKSDRLPASGNQRYKRYCWAELLQYAG